MTLVYATSTDYQAWPGVTSTPSNIAAILQSASLAVREATAMCYYLADTTGLPTDATIKQAFNDATCCQAAALVAIGYDPTTGGTVTATVKQSKGIGSAHIQIASADAQAASQAKKRVIEGLTLDAQRILRDAGLRITGPWVVG